MPSMPYLKSSGVGPTRVWQARKLVSATYDDARYALDVAINALRESIAGGDITVTIIAMNETGMVLDVVCEAPRETITLKLEV